MVNPAHLIADPLRIGSRYAFVLPQVTGNLKNKDAEVINDVVVHGGHVSEWVDHYQQVHGDSRVYTASFDVAAYEPHTCRVALAAYNGHHTATEASVYWLPWAGNQTFRVTLKPSKHLHAGTVDPDIFFTANLNGCMVSVDGAADQPTVYHSNVARYGGDPAANVHMADAAARTDIRKKRFKMYRYGYQRFSNTAALDKKTGGHGHARTPRHVTQLHYQVLRGRPSATGIEQAVRWAAAARFGLRPADLTGPARSHEIEVNDAMGAVFGVKRHGCWAFYYQKLVNYEYFHHGHFQDGDWIVVSCKKFWPGVSGFWLDL